MLLKIATVKKRKWLRVLNIVLISYIAIGVALYFLQDKFILHPTSINKEEAFVFNTKFEEGNLRINEGTAINFVKFLPKTDSAKGVVLYYHGNKQNIKRYAPFAEKMTNSGYEVWMPDYPTFGKSTGVFSEKMVQELAIQLYKMAAAKYSSDSIIIYGKSLGTGFASYVGSSQKAKHLILETPYYSIPTLFDCYAPIFPTERMSNFKIPQYEYIQYVKCPITIFHGTDDGVIPIRNAKRLLPLLKNGDNFITIDKGTHHNLADFEVYRRAMDSLLQ